MEFVSRISQENRPPFEAGGIPAWIQTLLYGRGIRTEYEMRRFLKPTADQLADPLALPGMRELTDAVRKRREARGNALRVTVYGDYDVDGICASVIMERAFRLCGAVTRVRIPDRHEEGYGLNAAAVREIARDTDILVTVDCGITSIEEVDLAKELGMTVLVTDHHTPGPELPRADAVVDPMLAGEGYSPLCGAGVAWKTLWALHGRQAAEEYLDICALATVADLVPLTGENRILVYLGLRQINSSPRIGVKALIRCARIREGADAVTSDRIAFQLAPRLNAAGRLDSAFLGYRLLTAGDEGTAMALAEQLEDLNRERKALEDQAFKDAEKQVERMPLSGQRGIVVFHENWDTGIIGLVAGKLAEKYAYPTICLTGNRMGEYQGSGRSACGVDLYQALKACEQYLTRFGGHKQAAGLALKPGNLETFVRAFSGAVSEQLGDGDLRDELAYDLEMPLQAVDEEHIRWMTLLEPFGMGNPRPLFRFDGCGISMRAVGSEGRHLKCVLHKDGTVRQGIWFSHGYLAGDALPAADVVAEMTLNDFGGRVSAECSLKGMRLNPDGLRDDPETEREGCLRDLVTLEGFEPRPPRADKRSWDTVPFSRRGTLYLCRRASTAAAVVRRYPSLEITVAKDLDRRAFSAAVLGADLTRVPEGYERLVLCDGALGDAEIAALNTLYPRAEVIVSPSDTAAGIRRSLVMGRETLRRLYVLSARWDTMGIQAVCEALGADLPQIKWGALAMARVALCEITDLPFRIRLLPRPPSVTDPFATAWYRLTEKGTKGE